MLGKILEDVLRRSREFEWVSEVLEEYREILEREWLSRDKPRGVVDIDIRRYSRAVVIGDIHGDLDTLVSILEQIDLERVMREDTLLIFLGDYIDRGDKQLETLLLVSKLKALYGERVITLRGNHEPPESLPVYPHDYPEILRWVFGPQWRSLYDLSRKIFDLLPYAAIYRGSAVFLHGGIPVFSTIDCWEDVKCILNAEVSERTLEEILWNDPTEEPDIEYAPSPRGAGYLWGEKITDIFLRKTGLKAIIRGHEAVWEGYKLNHGSRVITIFSRKGPPYYNAYAAALLINLREFRGFYRESIVLL
ncbi:MAG: metallophosphoesterase family protein [Sulfolobales archaeon]